MAKQEKKTEKKGGAPKGNKFAVGNEGGRPAMFNSPEDLQIKVDEYFEYIKGDLKEEVERVNPKTGLTQFIEVWNRRPEPATITGLALFLGFADKSSLYEYQEKQEFTHPIKKARTRIEHEYEKSLHFDKPTGSIFALKNMGWIDRKQIDQTVREAEPETMEEIDKRLADLESKTATD